MNQPYIFEFDNFRLDPRRRLLTRTGGAPVAIKAKPFDALVHLVEHAGELVTRASLTHALWPTTIVEDNSLNKVVVDVRRIVGERSIVTIPGRGYQFVAPVSRTPAIEAPEVTPPSVAPVKAPGGWIAPRKPIVVLIAAVVALGAGYATWRMARATGSPVFRTLSSVVPLTTEPGHAILPTLSPDGRQVAFAWQRGGGNRDVYVLRIGSQEPVRLTTDPAEDRDPSWSPDGNTIAFLRMTGPNAADVELVPATGGSERKLAAIRFQFIGLELTGRRIAWTPDGTRLLVTTRTEPRDDGAAVFSFHYLSTETGQMEPLRLAGSGYDTSPAFSPNGKWLAFTRYLHQETVGRLMVQELDGFDARGEPRAVPGAESETSRSPSWSPDSRHLVFVNGTQVVEWELGGALRPLSTPSGGPEWLGLAIDWHSQPLRAVAGRRELDANLWRQPLDPITHALTAPPTRLNPSSAQDRHPRFSPDGDRLVFVSDRSGADELWLADSRGEHIRQLTSLHARDLGAPSWAPDGARIAFHVGLPSAQPKVYVLDLDDDSTEYFVPGTNPSWSRDGQYIYVTEAGDAPTVARVRVADRERALAFTGDTARETEDGQAILYGGSDDGGLYLRVIGDPAPAAAQRLTADFAPRASFQPLRDGVFYVANEVAGTATEFRFYDYAQQAARTLAPAPPFTPSVRVSLTISQDGRELVYSASASGIGGDLVMLEFGGSLAAPVAR